MQGYETLGARLEETARGRPAMVPVCQVIARFAEAGAEISGMVSLGCLAPRMSETMSAQADGYAHREFDLLIHDLITDALRCAPVASILSEELGDWTLIDPDHPLTVAFEPLDGSSHLEANLSVGTIF